MIVLSALARQLFSARLGQLSIFANLHLLPSNTYTASPSKTEQQILTSRFYCLVSIATWALNSASRATFVAILKVGLPIIHGAVSFLRSVITI